MSSVRTHAAASMLGVSPDTLRSWERRYGFPKPQRSPGNHRRFALDEIEALRQTLAETHNVSSAIALARARGEGPSSPSRLAFAFGGYDESRADRLLEESLTLRSVERTVEEVLLPAVAAHPADSPEYDFACRHAAGWLSALKRLAPPQSRERAVLILDATAGGEFDALHAQALELALRRAGVRTLALTPTVDGARLGRAARALAPAAVVATGRRTSLEMIAALAYALRGGEGAPGALICDYRGAIPDTDAGTVCRLGDRVIAARDRLLGALDAPAPVAAGASTGATAATTVTATA